MFAGEIRIWIRVTHPCVMEIAVSNDRNPRGFARDGWTTAHLDQGLEIVKKSLTTSHLESAFAPEPPPEAPPPPASSDD